MDNYDWDTVMHFGDPMDSPTSKFDHLPTPPHSLDGSPEADAPETNDTLVSVSTTFFPAAQHHPHQPDLILLSKDAVHFYVHSDILLEASDNRFRAMLPHAVSEGDEQPVLDVPESSAVLNVILHAIYALSCSHYAPPFDTLVKAVESMPVYGLNPKSMIRPSTPLFTLLLSQAPLFPLELYALAAQFQIEELAVPTSAHLLAFPLSRLTDQDVDRIGASYLKRRVIVHVMFFLLNNYRLFFLHFGRVEALKRVLLPPPHPHPQTSTCDFQMQKGLCRAWALASAYLVWDVRPDMSTNALESALRPLAQHLSCDLCKNALDDRIRNLIIQWSVVKVGVHSSCL
ncbi:hypothetical protein GGX14DRAFT_509410 [Mycena pura]|uniref:BTB domain-containing protein n=1 Tax=Mycena pura TaxID=153505 RepID=A0AAD7E5E0_9AGAR|nr:hypothetical protein GGX14DRAFT_509410 [Mycena pura]